MATNVVPIPKGVLEADVPVAEFDIVNAQQDVLRIDVEFGALVSDLVLHLRPTVDMTWSGRDSAYTKSTPVKADEIFELRPSARGGDSRTFYYTGGGAGKLRVFVASINARLRF